MLDLLRRLFGFRFDWPEFLIGLVAGFILYLTGRRILPAMDWVAGQVGQQWSKLGEGLGPGPTDQFRNGTVARAQGHHLARALFRLEDVLVPPQVLAPPPDPSEVDAPREETLAVLPNLPDWNVLSGIYRAPAFPLAQAVSSSASFFLTGELGSGKSTALAYLALKVGMRSPELGAAAGLAPIWIHIADLQLDRWAGKDPLPPLFDAVTRSASSSGTQRLPAYLRNQLTAKKAILLIDGFDEMTVEEIAQGVTWLIALQKTFPGNQIVAAGPPRGYGGLVSAGLAPVVLAPWTEHDHRLFLSRWGSAWVKSVLPQIPKNRLAEVDPALVNGWLLGSVAGRTPLEMTLRTWSAYSGDILGGSRWHALQGYFLRILSAEERQHAQAAALNWIQGHQGALAEKNLRRGTPVADLVEAGLLVRRPGGHLSFFSPALGAFLAAQAMGDGGIPPEGQDAGWLPANTVMGFWAIVGDAGPEVRLRLQVTEDPLEENLLQCARWLRDAPRKAEWRNDVLRGLAKVLHDPSRPYGLRLRVAHALVDSGEASVGLLFRRLLTSETTSSRVLGALGSGGIRDEEAVEPLLRVLQEDRDIVARQAACLALAVIGTTPALEGLGRSLLQGEERVRMAVAEALACNPDDGYGILKDAVEMDDLLTRRAAIFGLARVPEEWVLPIVDKLQLEDKQWVVRGAAAEAAERRRKPRYTIRPPILDPAELPWLVAYATRQGMGVAPGRPALEMLRRALGNGTDEEKGAALEAIAWVGGDEFALDVSRSLQSDHAQLRDAAFEALWRLRAAQRSPESDRAAPS